jgi:hypothetical protein
MKKNTLFTSIIGILAIGFVMINMAFMPKTEKLSITNKTDSDIDEIHFNSGGDVVGDHEILHPGETIEVNFDCSTISKTTKVKVRLVFEDGKHYNFEDVVCNGTSTWEIKHDGSHKN